MIDYEILTKQIGRAYREFLPDKPIWTMADFGKVITHYYYLYNKVFHKEHPILKTETLADVMYKLPRDYEEEHLYHDLQTDDLSYSGGEFSEYLGCFHGDMVYRYDPENYMDDGEALILRYFYTDFDRCNYSICHFVSGDIRRLRMYEAMIYDI